MLSKINNKLKNDSKTYWIIREYITIILLFFESLTNFKKAKNKRIKVLFYHFSSLSFAGTEKSLQIISKYLNKEKFDVYFMFPENMLNINGGKDRYDFVRNGNVTMIPFTYEEKIMSPPYFVKGMNPPIKKIIKTLNIDYFFTADAGAAQFPFTLIRKTKIILINIFGQPNIQKNIVKHLCISKVVSDKIEHIVPKEKLKIIPIPLERVNVEDVRKDGNFIRQEFGIKDSDMVFGRIGRPADSIYDPIAITAFKEIVEENPNAHFIIMAPMPCVIERVKNEKIPNVHFINPSSDEKRIWAFHGAIDVLAHFRNDGETFGLNIAESMLVGNPIISHKSHIYNAHLEYLNDSFSRVTEQGDFKKYAEHMRMMIKMKDENKLQEMGLKAKEQAEKLFLIENVIIDIEKIMS